MGQGKMAQEHQEELVRGILQLPTRLIQVRQ